MEKHLQQIIIKWILFLIVGCFTAYCNNPAPRFMADQKTMSNPLPQSDTLNLYSRIKSLEASYNNMEKELYDSVSRSQNDNIDFSDITLGLESRYNKCTDAFEKTFLGFKLAGNYYIHFESSNKIEYMEKAKPLFISFMNFRNGEPASNYLTLDITKVHMIVNKWDSFSKKDQEDIMRYGLLRGFGNGLPEILNK